MVERKTIRPVQRLGPEPQDQTWLDSEELPVSLDEDHVVDVPAVTETDVYGINRSRHV